MGRKVNTAWFGAYRAAEAALSAAILAGTGQTEVVRQHAQEAGMKDQSFSRLIKAGRFLDSQVPTLAMEQVQCSYVQVEVLAKIARIAPEIAQDKLVAVIDNQVSLAELETLHAQLTEQNPVAQAKVIRESVRRKAATHERNCTEAVRQAGPAFFGAPGGEIFKQTKAREYVSPPLVVMHEGKPFASLYLRVGGQSKSALANAFELYDLACTRRDFTPNIWFIFPEHSDIVDCLAYLACRLGGSPFSGGWLKLATLPSADGTLNALDEIGFAAALERDFHLGGSLKPNFAWQGKSLIRDRLLTIEMYKPLAELKPT